MAYEDIIDIFLLYESYQSSVKIDMFENFKQ